MPASVLARDISTRCGWSRGAPGMALPAAGCRVWDAKNEGTRNREARDWLLRTVEINGVGQIVKEALPPMQGATNFASMSALGYLHGMACEVAATAGLSLKASRIGVGSTAKF